eukprot:2957677-Pyramimonas_sp.AAC.2
MRSVCKLVGEKSLKERLLEKCMPSAGSAKRCIIHRFNYQHVDWRWEYLEDVTNGLVHVLPILK